MNKLAAITRHNRRVILNSGHIHVPHDPDSAWPGIIALAGLCVSYYGWLRH